MNVRCLGYKALEKVRFSTLGAKLFYGGQRVLLKEHVEVAGVVTRTPSDETDGDCTFDVLADDGQHWHMEITPCQPRAIRAIACSLQVGWSVRVAGRYRWDPAHLGGAGHQEIHPVTTIVKL